MVPLSRDKGLRSNSCDNTTLLSAPTFMESNPTLLRGNKLLFGHLHDFRQVINCDRGIWVQRNTLPGQSSSTSFGESKRRSALTQNQPVQLHFHEAMQAMVHSASWKLARYMCFPHAAEREEEGQERPPSPFALQEALGPPAPRPMELVPALTALTHPLSQTQLWMLGGGK